jgi:predicted DNA-binding antitoxin AbrB/MazE fold protein
MDKMEIQHVQAVFEAGKLLPLEPLSLDEHERVEVTVMRASGNAAGNDEGFASALTSEADAKITLEQVQQAMAKIPGSLVNEFAGEGDERF